MYPEDKHTGLSGVEGSATKYFIHGITLSPFFYRGQCLNNPLCIRSAL